MRCIVGNRGITEWAEYTNLMKEGAVIAITISYSARRMVKDNDNLELRIIINILCTKGYLMNDSGDWLALFLHASMDRNCQSTTLTLMPKSEFPE